MVDRTTQHALMLEFRKRTAIVPELHYEDDDITIRAVTFTWDEFVNVAFPPPAKTGEAKPAEQMEKFNTNPMAVRTEDGGTVIIEGKL